MIFRLSGGNNRESKLNPFSVIMKKITKQYNFNTEFTIEAIRESWPALVDSLAANSRPEEIKNEILMLSSTHPAISNEIIMLKSTIIARLNEKFGVKIKDIRIASRRSSHAK